MIIRGVIFKTEGNSIEKKNTSSYGTGYNLLFDQKSYNHVPYNCATC